MTPASVFPRARFLQAVAAIAAILGGASWLPAEPYMAVRTGYRCSQCHLSPTGGGKRNRFGVLYSQTALPSATVGAGDIERFREWLRPAQPAAGKPQGLPDDITGAPPAELPPEPERKPLVRSTLIDGYLTDFLSVGADFRFSLRSTFPQGGSSTTTFDTTEGNLYGSLEPFDDTLALYIDETVAPGGASAREAFGLLRGPLGSYAKAGLFVLPYGLRLQDDTAFIRELTGFNHGVQDLGVEIGLEPGPFSASFAISNGSGGTSDDNRDKQLTGMAGYMGRSFRIGAQGTWNNGPDSRRAAFGATAAFSIGRLTLLGEADEVIDEVFGPGGGITHALLLYGEADYLLARGINLKFTYDFADPDTGISKDSFTRVGGGVEWFPTQFTQLRLLASYRDESDRSGKPDTVAVTFEIHLFF